MSAAQDGAANGARRGSRLSVLAMALLGAMALAGCDRPQLLTHSQERKVDQQAWQTVDDPFLAPGWTPGDATRWNEQLRKRAQNQNEYVRFGL